MKYVTLATIFLFMVRKSLAEDDEEVCCAPRFVDGLRSCPNFDNQNFNEAALVFGFQGEDEEIGGLRISGSFDISMDFDDENEIELTIQKLTNLGKQYMYGATANICASLKDEYAPWTPVFKSVNITGCPVKQGVYPIREVIMNIDFAKDLMKHEFCGEYEVVFSILHRLEKVLCFIVSLEIYEKS